MPSDTNSPTILLVHGGFVDGSGWLGVHKALKAAGHEVLVTQHPTKTLQGDAEYVTSLIDAVGGPVLLAGHSYGGFVITEAGKHRDVVGLVYVSAFAPDAGDTIMGLLKDAGPDAQPLPIKPIHPGFLHLDRSQFREFFAADVDEADATFMADSQVPWGESAIGSSVDDPSWKSKPSWYLVSKDDRMIPPQVQRMMAERAGSTTVEVEGSHCAYITQAQATADLISKAAARFAKAD